MTTVSEVVAEYEENSAIAYRYIDDTYYWCRCCGMSRFGEAWFEPLQGNPFPHYDEDGEERVDWLAWEELKLEALFCLRHEWNYDGFGFSDPKGGGSCGG